MDKQLIEARIVALEKRATELSVKHSEISMKAKKEAAALKLEFIQVNAKIEELKTLLPKKDEAAAVAEVHTEEKK